MNLREARVQFTILFSTKLIPKAIELGFEPAYDEIMNHENVGHRTNSLHYSGCAGDLLLYKDQVYQPKLESYRELGEYWESLVDPDYPDRHDCHWGGNFKDEHGNPAPDADHFSFAPIEIFNGRR